MSQRPQKGIKISPSLNPLPSREGDFLTLVPWGRGLCYFPFLEGRG